MLPTSPCPDPLFLCNRACFRTACHSALTSESAESDTKRFLFAEKLIQISKRQDWTPKAEFCGSKSVNGKIGRRRQSFVAGSIIKGHRLGF